MSLEKYIAKLFSDLNNLFSWLFLMTSFKMFESFELLYKSMNLCNLKCY